MKTEDLILAAEDLNVILFDSENKENGWINLDESPADIEKSVRDASLFLLGTDNLADTTVAVLKLMKFKTSDFEKMNLHESLNPLPLFHKYGIIEEPKKKPPKPPKDPKPPKPPKDK